MKVKLYYHFRQYDWEDEGALEIFLSDMTATFTDRILLQAIECEIPDVDLPTRDQVAKFKVNCLTKEKEKLKAEMQLKINHIEDKIRQLQALECKEVKA